MLNFIMWLKLYDNRGLDLLSLHSYFVVEFLVWSEKSAVPSPLLSDYPHLETA